MALKGQHFTFNQEMHDVLKRDSIISLRSPWKNFFGKARPTPFELRPCKEYTLSPFTMKIRSRGQLGDRPQVNEEEKKIWAQPVPQKADNDLQIS
ncbi:hypothetical protein AVEN_56511-1 [Araneus ventricosus]|uniref:Uncharacterized protein n=1 Tax=Araneus ventricosus TaxID=182803 RepID=A0A4Y2LU76_ARAVE|nr:hypothetical protein AVEN_56511-1 [Araneus ventricosus]